MTNDGFANCAEHTNLLCHFMWIIQQESSWPRGVRTATRLAGARDAVADALGSLSGTVPASELNANGRRVFAALVLTEVVISRLRGEISEHHTRADIYRYMLTCLCIGLLAPVTVPSSALCHCPIVVHCLIH